MNIFLRAPLNNQLLFKRMYTLFRSEALMLRKFRFRLWILLNSHRNRNIVAWQKRNSTTKTLLALLDVAKVYAPRISLTPQFGYTNFLWVKLNAANAKTTNARLHSVDFEIDTWYRAHIEFYFWLKIQIQWNARFCFRFLRYKWRRKGTTSRERERGGVKLYCVKYPQHFINFY